MNKYLSSQIDQYFIAHKELNYKNESTGHKPVTVIGLAIDKYLENQSLPKNVRNKFKESAIYQLKGLILAGHGTTSNTLCFISHLLSNNLPNLQHIREEHDNLLGRDIDKTSSVITIKPHVLNQLPYTLAVIKESLRLFPADSGSRRRDKRFSLTEDDRQYPTQGCMVWTVHQTLYREPRYWPQPDIFISEHWLVPEDHPLHPVKGAWRPFEFEPRNCIGQELLILKMKLALVMTIQEFDFSARFEE